MENVSKSEAKLWAIAHQYTIVPEDITLLIIFYICASACDNKTGIEYIEEILSECGMNEITKMLRKELYKDALLLYKKLYYVEGK